MAEAHPVGFQWVMEAKKRGAKIIHVDPRFSRTSAVADLHVPIRAGADIAFVGGLINYVLQNDKYFREYVRRLHQRARRSSTEDFADTEDLDGLFSGLRPRAPDLRRRDLALPGRRGGTRPAAPAAWHAARKREVRRGARAARRTAPAARPRTRTRTRDETLQHPRCVFQILKRHFARYTPEMVARGRRGPRGASSSRWPG